MAEAFYVILAAVVLAGAGVAKLPEWRSGSDASMSDSFRVFRNNYVLVYAIVRNRLPARAGTVVPL